MIDTLSEFAEQRSVLSLSSPLQDMDNAKPNNNPFPVTIGGGRQAERRRHRCERGADPSAKLH